MIRGGDVVTMNAPRDVLVGGSIVVDDDVIVAVGSTTELDRRYPDATVLDAATCVVTPGMIDAHQHLTGDPLVRSCIPDLLPAGDSIFEWSVPLHGAHGPLDDEIAASLSAVEALTNGVTTVVEAGTVADAGRVAGALTAAGLRATLGVWGWDIEEGPFAAPTAEVLERQRAVVDAHPPGGLVEGWVTLVGHDLASDALLAGAAELARELGTGMTMHMSPTSSDPQRYLERTGRRPVEHLDDLGVLGRHLLIGHGVWLDDAEVELVLASETAIAYCPWAYLRLGQGVFANGRHAEIVERGGRVALGCDAANAGDAIDVLRTAAAGRGHRPRRPDRSDALRCPSGVRTGDDRRGGSDRPRRPHRVDRGRQAGRPRGPPHRHARAGPRGDVGLQLVWGTDGRSVRDVFVAGRHVVADGRVVSIDVDALAAAAADQQRHLLARAGITVPHPWPHLDAH